MQLNEQAIQRIEKANFDGKKTADLLRLIAASAEAAGSATGSLTLDYQEPGDKIERGDLIPVLTFSIRPATYNPRTLDEGRLMPDAEASAATGLEMVREG